MFKKILITTILLLAVLLTPQVSYAKTVCTQEYGQPVVCYEEEEKVLAAVHEPVEAGILDSPLTFATLLLFVSLGFTFLSRKVRQETLRDK